MACFTGRLEILALWGSDPQLFSFLALSRVTSRLTHVAPGTLSAFFRSEENEVPTLLPGQTGALDRRPRPGQSPASFAAGTRISARSIPGPHAATLDFLRIGLEPRQLRANIDIWPSTHPFGPLARKKVLCHFAK